MLELAEWFAGAPRPGGVGLAVPRRTMARTCPVDARAPGSVRSPGMHGRQPPVRFPQRDDSFTVG